VCAANLAMSSVEPSRSFKKPGAARRRAVDLQSESLVRCESLGDGRELPVVVRPTVDGLNLVEWSESNKDLVERLLLEHKALLFRGFRLQSGEEFGQFATTTSGSSLMSYRDRSTPRHEVASGVYVSTIYPADECIELHNEGTYWKQWALRLYFCCLVAPEQGGQTPIANIARVFSRIDPAIRRTFAERDVMYVRNYDEDFGLPWQEVFQVSTRDEVEAYCATNDITCEWRDGDRLRTRQIRPAARVHPLTGEDVWFNHAAFFHISSRTPEVRRTLLEAFGEEELPFNTYYGCGSPLEADVVAHLRDAYRQEKVMFDWHPGDAMLLDNMTVAHAREPYVGAREVIVAMTSPYDGTGGPSPEPDTEPGQAPEADSTPPEPS
jgi:alpha-ketoglutarate-dependent taurine dioxygenase